MSEAAEPNTPPPVPKSQTKWPIILGVVGIIFGGINVLTAPLYFAQGITMEMSMQPYVDQGLTTAEQVEQYVDKWAPTMKMTAIVGLGLSLLLLVGGIALVKRKKIGHRFVLVWAVFAITALPYIMLKTTAMVSDQFSMILPEDGVETALGIAKVVKWVILGVWMIIPTFIIYWLVRKDVRQDVRSW